MMTISDADWQKVVIGLAKRPLVFVGDEKSFSPEKKMDPVFTLDEIEQAKSLIQELTNAPTCLSK